MHVNKTNWLLNGDAVSVVSVLMRFRYKTVEFGTKLRENCIWSGEIEACFADMQAYDKSQLTRSCIAAWLKRDDVMIYSSYSSLSLSFPFRSKIA
jgi:hypothetical protein